MDPNRPMPTPRARSAKAGSRSLLRESAEAPKLIQELQLHKIELEMQNEELQRVQEDLKEARRQVDQLVVERTAELTRAITKLSEEVQLRYQAELALRQALLEAQGAREVMQAENLRLRLELGRS